MKPINFLGPAYIDRSRTVAANRLVNFFPELHTEDAKNIISLVGTPGTAAWLSAATSGFTSPVRGWWVFNNLLFVVVGSNLYSISTNKVVTLINYTIATSNGRVQMADNGLTASGVGGNQLAITDGVNLYIYNVTTGIFTTLTSSTTGCNPAQIEQLDGYFIILDGISMTYFVSDLYDGTTWNGLAFASITSTTSSLINVINYVQQLWFFKQDQIEVWYDTGTPTSQGSPFSRIAGAIIPFGVEAPNSVALGSAGIFWLCDKSIGVVQTVSYIPTPVTTPGIVYEWSQYAIRSDAFGYCYEAEGHEFYVITFPTANATWVYDATTQMWHERSTYSSSPYQVNRHLAQNYTLFNNMHLVSDYRNGNIYQMSSNFYDDNGSPIVSYRIGPILYDKEGMKPIFVQKLEIDCESGVGNSNAPTPQAALSWSRDGGNTWSNEYLASLGAQGQYGQTLKWRKLGWAKGMTYRLMISDSCKKVLVNAFAEIEL